MVVFNCFLRSCNYWCRHLLAVSWINEETFLLKNLTVRWRRDDWQPKWVMQGGYTNVTRTKSGSMPRRRKDGSKIKSRLQLDIPQKLMTSPALTRGRTRATAAIHIAWETRRFPTVAKRIFAHDRDRNPVVKSLVIRSNIFLFSQFLVCGVGMVQSVQRLATGWKVRGSNPGGGEIFRTYPDRLWGLPSLLYNGYLVFHGGKGGRGVVMTTHPNLLCRGSRKRVELYLCSP